MARLPIDDYYNDDQALADYTSRLPVELPQQLVGPNAANAVNNLFAPVGDKPRYQTWPEVMLRSGATLPGDVVQGRIPMSLGLRREDYTDIPQEQGPSPTWLGSKLGLREGAELGPSGQLIERTQDLSGMAGGGFATKPNAVIAAAESARVGAPIAAMEKAPIFYSAVENAVRNSTPINEKIAKEVETFRRNNKDKAPDTNQLAEIKNRIEQDAAKNPNNYKEITRTADQWLGKLRNQPGVKQEELDWVLHELPKGPITKSELEAFVNEHKVELKEVEKQGPREWHQIVYNDTLSRRMADFDKILNEFKSPADIDIAKKHNIAFKETVRGYDNDQIWNAIQEAKNIPNHDNIMVDNTGQGAIEYGTLAEAESAIKNAGAENHARVIKRESTDKETKYQSYQLPGANNYKEMLLTLPEHIDNRLARADIERRWKDGELTQGAYEAELEHLVGPGGKLGHSFTSSHWNEPNVLAHVRTNERTIPGVGNSLHIEEIQSDFGQAHRKERIKIKEAINKDFDSIADAMVKAGVIKKICD